MRKDYIAAAGERHILPADALNEDSNFFSIASRMNDIVWDSDATDG